MRVHVESILECEARLAWAAVVKSETLLQVSRPLMVVAPVKNEQLPARWEQGATVRLRLLFFGVIPMGVHTVFFEQVDDAAMTVQTREHDALIRTWDHRMLVVPHSDWKCGYSDDVEIHAGLLTWGVWLFAAIYYRHRQRRWRNLARKLQEES